MKMRRWLALLLVFAFLLTGCKKSESSASYEWLESFDFSAETSRVLKLITTTAADDASLAELKTLMDYAGELPHYYFSPSYTGTNRDALTNHARTMRTLLQMMLDIDSNAWNWPSISEQTHIYLTSLRATAAPEADTKWLPLHSATQPEDELFSAIVACFLRAKHSNEQKNGIVSITFGGDVTFGQLTGKSAFDTAFNSHDGDLSFTLSMLAPYLKTDSLSVVNCEGTFTNQPEARDPATALRGSPGYAGMFAAGGIEAVSLANEHTLDYFESGYEDTKNNLANANVNSFGGKELLVCETEGVQIGLLGHDLTQPTENLEATLKQNIETLRQRGAQIIVASFHWGEENSSAATKAQTDAAHLAVDLGADMVVGHHPQVLQGMEIYNGKPILYSLGTLVSTATPTLPDKGATMLVRQTFQKNDDGTVTPLQTMILPARVSSAPNANNYMPQPVFGDDSDHVVRLLFKLSRVFEFGPKTLVSIS